MLRTPRFLLSTFRSASALRIRPGSGHSASPRDLSTSLYVVTLTIFLERLALEFRSVVSSTHVTSSLNSPSPSSASPMSLAERISFQSSAGVYHSRSGRVFLPAGVAEWEATIPSSGGPNGFLPAGVTEWEATIPTSGGPNGFLLMSVGGFPLATPGTGEWSNIPTSTLAAEKVYLRRMTRSLEAHSTSRPSSLPSFVLPLLSPEYLKHSSPPRSNRGLSAPHRRHRRRMYQHIDYPRFLSHFIIVAGDSRVLTRFSSRRGSSLLFSGLLSPLRLDLWYLFLSLHSNNFFESSRPLFVAIVPRYIALGGECRCYWRDALAAPPPTPQVVVGISRGSIASRCWFAIAPP